MLRDILNNDIYKNFAKITPFPIRDYAKELGLVIAEENLKFTRSGSLHNNIITVNAIHIESRKNFTIAHELAHYLLGHGNQEKEYVNRDSEANYSKEQLKQEEEADELASELLMPEQKFKEKIDEYLYIKRLDKLNHSDIKFLATDLSTYFSTSKSSIIVRLKNLSYVSKWDWIYLD
jgi:Zn-dependent peptidase ImmA (M78 family)